MPTGKTHMPTTIPLTQRNRAHNKIQDIPLILVSARSFPLPTSMKSKEAMAWVKPEVNCFIVSSLSTVPLALVMYERPGRLAMNLAITSTSPPDPVGLWQSLRIAFLRA